jgi:hypothetical protein
MWYDHTVDIAEVGEVGSSALVVDIGKVVVPSTDAAVSVVERRMVMPGQAD